MSDSWLSIDTAPKDGQRILLCCGGQYVTLGWWNLIDGFDHANGNRLVQLTHWMPLREKLREHGDAGNRDHTSTVGKESPAPDAKTGPGIPPSLQGRLYLLQTGQTR